MKKVGFWERSNCVFEKTKAVRFSKPNRFFIYSSAPQDRPLLHVFSRKKSNSWQYYRTILHKKLARLCEFSSFNISISTDASVRVRSALPLPLPEKALRRESSAEPSPQEA
jgi:hypothetical protein